MLETSYSLGLFLINSIRLFKLNTGWERDALPSSTPPRHLLALLTTHAIAKGNGYTTEHKINLPRLTKIYYASSWSWTVATRCAVQQKKSWSKQVKLLHVNGVEVDGHPHALQLATHIYLPWSSLHSFPINAAPTTTVTLQFYMCGDRTSSARVLAPHMHLGREKVAAIRVWEGLTISKPEPRTRIYI